MIDCNRWELNLKSGLNKNKYEQKKNREKEAIATTAQKKAGENRANTVIYYY